MVVLSVYDFALITPKKAPPASQVQDFASKTNETASAEFEVLRSDCDVELSGPADFRPGLPMTVSGTVRGTAPRGGQTVVEEEDIGFCIPLRGHVLLEHCLFFWYP